MLYILTSKSKSPKGVLDVGEILSASDEETERPKVEPCSLAFCVSHVAGRVHVLDAGFFMMVSPDSIAVGSS